MDYFYLGNSTTIDSKTRVVMYAVFCGLAVVAALVSHFGLKDISGTTMPGMDSRSLHISFSEGSLAYPVHTAINDTDEPLIDEDGVLRANSISNARRIDVLPENDIPSFSQVRSWLTNPKMISIMVQSVYNGCRISLITMVLPTITSNSFKRRAFVPLTGIITAIGQMLGAVILGVSGSKISNHSWMLFVFLVQTYMNYTTFFFFGEYSNTSPDGPHFASPSLAILTSGAFLYGVIDNIAQVLVSAYIVRYFKENTTVGLTINTCVTGLTCGVFLFLNSSLNSWLQAGINQGTLFVSSLMTFLLLDPV